MIIRWKEIYATGISDTDQWNKKLVNIINEFYKHIFTEGIIEDPEKIVNQMITESIMHFSVEKQLFNRYNFTPGSIAKHIDQHNSFVKVLEYTLRKIKSGDVLVWYSLADFLRSWIVKHMLGSDKEFALFVKETNKITA